MVSLKKLSWMTSFLSTSKVSHFSVSPTEMSSGCWFWKKYGQKCIEVTPILSVNTLLLSGNANFSVSSFDSGACWPVRRQGKDGRSWKNMEVDHGIHSFELSYGLYCQRWLRRELLGQAESLLLFGTFVIHADRSSDAWRFLRIVQ